jgi:hypothetical protein
MFNRVVDLTRRDTANNTKSGGGKNNLRYNEKVSKKKRERKERDAERLFVGFVGSSLIID